MSFDPFSDNVQEQLQTAWENTVTSALGQTSSVQEGQVVTQPVAAPAPVTGKMTALYIAAAAGLVIFIISQRRK